MVQNTCGQRGCSHCRVFAIKYRTTPCDRPIANQAKQVGKLAADPHANMKPASLNCASQVTGCYSLLVQCHSFASRATTRAWICAAAACAYDKQPGQHVHCGTAPGDAVCDACRAP
jgi:hypothetical protein